MIGTLRILSLYLGRGIMGGLFLYSALYLDTKKFDALEKALEGALPASLTNSAAVLLVAAIFAKTVGGALILVGIGVRLGALALIAFMVGATYLFHMDLGDPQGFIAFQKNAMIISGLMVIYATAD